MTTKPSFGSRFRAQFNPTLFLSHTHRRAECSDCMADGAEGGGQADWLRDQVQIRPNAIT